MGIYFIAAGNSSKNRTKTLDSAHTLSDICDFLTKEDGEKLKLYFNDDESVFLWGANNTKEVAKVNSGDYVIDVKNKEVIQVFTFCFYVPTDNGKLQNYVGWDQEIAPNDRRPYGCVYFLKSPKKTIYTEKRYFQVAFNQSKNQQWLVAQKYFDDAAVRSAMSTTHTDSVETLIGIAGGEFSKVSELNQSQSAIVYLSTRTPKIVVREESPKVAWLNLLESKIQILKADQQHQERDHEVLVEFLFEILGYERIHDIKFRRGYIDISIYSNNSPKITIEVKKDWSLSPESRKALSQAFNYSGEIGTRYVVITNGDRYCFYDKRQGTSYQEHLIRDFSISAMTHEDLSFIEHFRKENIDA